MKTRLLALAVIAGGIFTIQANIRTGETFAEDIAPILYDKCVSCHHTGGIGPMSLIEYDTVYDNRFLIQSSVVTGEMPPWPPDENYQTYAHERLLSPTEIQMIMDWVSDGAPEGDPNLTPPPPVIQQAPILGTPDLTLTAPNYMSSATSQVDDYVCFVIPSGLLTDKKVQAVEIEAGNPSIVHHCLIFIDETGNYQQDTTSHECVGPTSGTLIGEFTPGSSPTIYPSGPTVKMGVTLPANSNVVLAMHYPEGSAGQMDQTKVHFYFHPDGTQGVREISIDRLVENWLFCVPANQTQSVDAQWPNGAGSLPQDWSVLAVFPHMHTIGTSIKSYAIDPQGDTIKMVNVPQWDFEWQGFYHFKNPQFVPQGSTFYSEGEYDNTILNPNNPNNPPQTICAGLNTSDEMFLTYYMHTPYEVGDEFLNIDSMLNVSAEEIYARDAEPFSVLAYPNPFNDQISFMYQLPERDDVTLNIYSTSGQRVRSIDAGTQLSGTQSIIWNGRSDAGAQLSNGLYYYQMVIGDRRVGGQVMLSK